MIFNIPEDYYNIISKFLYTISHYNLFLDHIKTNNKTVSLEDIAIIESDNNEATNDRLDLLDMLDDTLGLFKKEVLLITHEMSLRKAEAETGVSHLKLHYHKQKGLDKLRQKYKR